MANPSKSISASSRTRIRCQNGRFMGYLMSFWYFKKSKIFNFTFIILFFGPLGAMAPWSRAGAIIRASDTHLGTGNRLPPFPGMPWDPSPRFVPRVRGTNRGPRLLNNACKENEIKEYMILTNINNMKRPPDSDLTVPKRALKHPMSLGGFRFWPQPECIQSSINQVIHSSIAIWLFGIRPPQISIQDGVGFRPHELGWYQKHG